MKLQHEVRGRALPSFVLCLVSYIYLFVKILGDFVLKTISNAKYLVDSLFSRKTDKLLRTPAHLSLIFNEKIISVKSVCDLISWSYTLGIRNISLYDFKGEKTGFF